MAKMSLKLSVTNKNLDDIPKNKVIAWQLLNQKGDLIAYGADKNPKKTILEMNKLLKHRHSLVGCTKFRYRVLGSQIKGQDYMDDTLRDLRRGVL